MDPHNKHELSDDLTVAKLHSQLNCQNGYIQNHGRLRNGTKPQKSEKTSRAGIRASSRLTARTSSRSLSEETKR